MIYLGVLGLGLLLEWLWPTRLLSRPVAVAVGSGLSLALNTWWALALTPALIWIMHAGVVKREEEYLERKFGNDYLRYKQQVPRWL